MLYDSVYTTDRKKARFTDKKQWSLLVRGWEWAERLTISGHGRILGGAGIVLDLDYDSGYMSAFIC